MPADLRDRFWLCFTLDHSEDDAAARFAARYGSPPALIVEWDGLLRVGPVPER